MRVLTCFWGPQGIVLRVNGAQAAVLGHLRGALNGRPLLQLVRSDDVGLLRREIEGVASRSDAAPQIKPMRCARSEPLPTGARCSMCVTCSIRWIRRSETQADLSSSARPLGAI